MKNITRCTHILMFFVIVIVISSIAGSSMLFAQTIVPEIKTILHTLPLEKQEWLRDFNERIERYIMDKSWHDNNFGGEFKVNMEFLLQDISTSSEERYRTNLLVSNGHDIQYFDKRCRFKYRHGEQISSDNLEQRALTHLIDFYVYILLGGEFDKYGTLEGTIYYERARDIARQAKFGLGRFIDGWDLRERLIENILSDEYKPYREMVDYYYYSLSIVEDDVEKAREYCTEAINRIVAILTNDPNHDSCRKFLDVHRREIIELFKDAKDTTVLKQLAEIDPDNAEVYIK